MNNFLPIYFLVISLTLISCSATKPDENLPYITVAELKEKLNSAYDKINSLEAYGSISFDSPEQSGSGSFELKIRKPDTLYIKIEGPFGISVANALITRNDFIYYNVQENTVIRGPSSELNIGAILKIKASFGQLINGLTGNFRLDGTENDTVFAKVENGNYIIENVIASGYEKFFISPELLFKRYEYRSSDNLSVLETDYSKYFLQENLNTALYFPGKVTIKNKSKKQNIYLEYESVNFNKAGMKFSMKIPSSAKQLKWD
ncbi:MAG: DUF4292 domain-containing protein [Ignavibacteria bacterium]|nr:DUF4292 domain-containing protein [Ignavibacteria bacterium]